jgi:hypothetical protein
MVGVPTAALIGLQIYRLENHLVSQGSFVIEAIVIIGVAKLALWLMTRAAR